MELSEILNSWRFDPNNNVRRITSTEGREVIQVRLPLGIEQYELHGRPDGVRPNDCESWFDFYRQQAGAAPWEFQLQTDDFEKLHHESLLYYYRYVLFFQIQEYRLCARDTRRNLEVVEFVCKHGPPPKTAALVQYRPYILQMHFMARALFAANHDKNIAEALKLLEEGQNSVESLPALDGNQVFRTEKSRALRNLRSLSRKLSRKLPLSPTERLRRELSKAVSHERYEEAARIRDEIARLNSPAPREAR